MAEKVIGKWEQPIPLQNVAVHASLLYTGEILYWGRRGDPKAIPEPIMDERFTKAYLWNPNTQKSRALEKEPTLENTNMKVNLFCSGHAFQPDGTLLVIGGHEFDGQGVNQACVFDPKDSSWSAKKTMVAGRWYPSAMTLADGRVLVNSGSFTRSWNIVNVPQIWEKQTNTWQSVSVTPSLALYPRLHLCPDGRVFMAGPSAQSQFLDVNVAVTDEKGLAVKDQSGNQILGAWKAGRDRLAKHREYAPSVQYDSGKIMYIGGGNDPPDGTADGEKRLPTNITEFFDLRKPDLGWTTSTAASMNFRRQQHNATVLPDGTVLVTGGTQGTGFNNLDADQVVRTSELWDPATSTWTVMAKESADRCYHSVALLLQDGQVFSAGGGEYLMGKDANFNLTNAQLYKPPYFFKGRRPDISTFPANVTYGQPFPVTVAADDVIKKASWVRLGSVTHSNNFTQSLMFLAEPKQKGTTVTVQPPANANEAPPGHYMLFLLNEANLPCLKAPIISIGPVPPVLPKKQGPALAQRRSVQQHVAMATHELDQKISTEQERPAVAIGLTPLCHYGLGPCWGGAYDALQQMSNVEVVRPIPSHSDSVAFVYLKQDILPDIDQWRSEFESTANGAYVMRGIELTLSGPLTKKRVGADEQLTLAATETRPELRLEPFQATSQVKWDKSEQATKPITDAEAGAYAKLAATVATGATVQVTGWLQKHDTDTFSLHVRTFKA